MHYLKCETHSDDANDAARPALRHFFLQINFATREINWRWIYYTFCTCNSKYTFIFRWNSISICSCYFQNRIQFCTNISTLKWIDRREKCFGNGEFLNRTRNNCRKFYNSVIKIIILCGNNWRFRNLSLNTVRKCEQIGLEKWYDGCGWEQRIILSTKI